jgi:hypothetical protein
MYTNPSDVVILPSILKYPPLNQYPRTGGDIGLANRPGNGLGCTEYGRQIRLFS